MDVARERTSRILELREMLLTFQIVNAAVVCAILESISALDPSSLINCAQVLEACHCLKLLPIYFDICFDTAVVVCYRLGLFCTDLHAVGCGGLV